MRIVLLMQWFDPEPTFKGLAFAKELARQGHDVQVLTGFPNYPEGRLYPGYRLRPWRREVVDGIPVLRVALYPSHDGSGLRRALNYLSFALSASVLGPLLLKRADVVYAYHAPGTIALPAMVLKLFRGIPFVYDVNDLWPDSLPATGMLNNPALLRSIEWWCNLTYRQARHVVVGTPGIRRTLIQRGVPADKVTVIPNWCDEAQLLSSGEEAAPEITRGMQGRFTVVFAGNIGKAQALDAVFEAAHLIGQTHPRVQFLIVGGGVELDRLKAEKERRRLDNVTFVPRLPMSTVGSLLRRADALLVHLRDDPLFRITVPSKTQAYMAIGRPIIMAVAGDAADMVEAAEGGIACAPENPRSIADAIREMAGMDDETRSRMGSRGAAFYWKELSLATGVRHFERIFARAIG